MRTMRPGVAPLVAALTAATVLSTALTAQAPDPYPMTLDFGTGLINIPVAWVSPTNADVWVNMSGKDLPSQTAEAAMNWMTRWNQNIAIDTHWGGRVSAGFSLYDQNPDWGFFGQALLVRPNEMGFLPAIAVGVRNIGPDSHEDRFLIGHDIMLGPDGRYHHVVPARYAPFHTANTIYAVATKDFQLSSRGGGTSLGLTIGGGDGLFSQDGGLGAAYNQSGTLVKGMFGGARLTTHPSLNTTLTLMAENDAWDFNAGILGDWRGITLGVYGTELENNGARSPSSFDIYNYRKINLSLGYSGNLVDISKGFILRGHITELARQQQLLRYEIAQRNRRIRGLEVALGKAQNGELESIAQRRADLQKQVEAEQSEIQRAEDRLRQLERQQQAPSSPTPPSQNPPSNPPTL